jgi:putative endonuclease
MANGNANNNADKNANKSTSKSTHKGNSHRPLALTSPKQRQGSYFERQACEFLQAQGLLLVAQNWQQPKVGELDLVMVESGPTWSTLVFIEVRQRLRSGYGDAALSVTKAKQRKIIKTAKYFLSQHPKYAHYDCRFDVIAYNVTRLAKNMDSDKGHTTTIDSHRDYSLDISADSKQANGLVEQPLVEDQLIEDSPINSQPEWLIGAFMAKAW